jgi:hypothetical protein
VQPTCIHVEEITALCVHSDIIVNNHASCACQCNTPGQLQYHCGVCRPLIGSCWRSSSSTGRPTRPSAPCALGRKCRRSARPWRSTFFTASSHATAAHVLALRFQSPQRRRRRNQEGTWRACGCGWWMALWMMMMPMTRTMRVRLTSCTRRDNIHTHPMLT